MALNAAGLNDGGAVADSLGAVGTYSPIVFPKISFMSPRGGTRGHAGTREGTESLQMRLFEPKGGERP